MKKITIEPNPCKFCPQLTCELRGRALTSRQVASKVEFGGPPSYYLNCHGFVCAKAAEVVSETIKEPDFPPFPELMPLNTSDKPCQEKEGFYGVTGRYFDAYGNVFLFKNGERIFLTNCIEVPPLSVMEVIRQKFGST